MKLKLKYCLTGVSLLLVWLIVRNRYVETVVEVHTEPQISQFLTVPNRTEPEREVTLVLRYSRESTKQVTGTINSFLSVFPYMPVIIVSDSLIPREIYHGLTNSSGVINIPLKLDLLNLILDRSIASHVRTKYVLTVPIGVISLLNREVVHLIKVLTDSSSELIALPTNSRDIMKCLKVDLNLRQWMMSYRHSSNYSDCSSVRGEHGIFMETKTLSKIGEPFLMPFPEALYIQVTALNLRTKLLKSPMLKVKKELKRADTAYKNQIQRQIMNKLFKIKKVIREDGTIEWYGCTRNTSRCFPNIINSVPDYLNQGRWTPPCCLKVLRETVHHVFKVLKDWNVTFWLEGGSLLGAMRMKDIIPWDYDVDIGIYLDDIDKCPWLQRVKLGISKDNQLGSVVDNEGFVWEKSSPEEGDFYRVQASVHNHIHVDIFPFYSKNGVMTKKTWFLTHPQDMEFPEHYLKPLTTIEFAGIEAPAPNNVREFLEMKFGKGCVENPQYPNSKVFPFPKQAKLFLSNETDSLMLKL